MEKTTIYISLGSNLGDRADNLKFGLDRLGNTTGVEINAISSVYATSPVGTGPQPEFLNAAVRLHTDLSPMSLLHVCAEIEKASGRDPGEVRWAPRTLDIDIIFFGNARIDTPELTVPHPCYKDRLFVLLPLLELEPELTEPGGRPLKEILEEGKKSNIYADQRVEKLYILS